MWWLICVLFLYLYVESRPLCQGHIYLPNWFLNVPLEFFSSNPLVHPIRKWKQGRSHAMNKWIYVLKSCFLNLIDDGSHLIKRTCQLALKWSSHEHHSISNKLVQNDKQYIKTAPYCLFDTLRPRQNGRHFPDDIFKWIFVNENA